MKVYPSQPGEGVKGRLSRLSTQHKIQRIVALVVAFLSVFSFFFKILFF